MSNPPKSFDVENHKRNALERYQKVRAHYEEFAKVIRSILEEALTSRGIKVASVEARAKPLPSFERKASEPDIRDPSRPKYADPLTDIQDLCGARVITFLPNTVAEVDKTIKEEFVVFERTDKAETLREEERFGYLSVHYIVRLRENRASLPEYRRFKDNVAEIQVRTILQHAWAEIEHDIQYKSVETIPSSVRRRFMSLAGVLEMADREFQGIQDEDERLRQVARASVRQGKLEDVEITPDALKAYLDAKLGPDGRMTTYSYDWTARLLLRLGFINFRQIDECITPYDDDRVSRAADVTRQGQLTRFETQLLAATGERFIKVHPSGIDYWWEGWQRDRLKKLKEAGVSIGNYEPSLSSPSKET